MINIYEDQTVETTFDELKALVAHLVMSLMVASRFTIVNTHQVDQDIVESRPQPKGTEAYLTPPPGSASALF